MNRFERWFMRRVIVHEVRQGFDHDKRIIALYQMVRDACEQEFYEDNMPTLNSFLAESFEKTQWKGANNERARDV